ncbi:hypothetical protein [Sinomonas soli]
MRRTCAASHVPRQRPDRLAAQGGHRQGRVPRGVLVLAGTVFMLLRRMLG